MQTIRTTLHTIQTILSSVAEDLARREAEAIIEQVTGCSRTTILTQGDTPVSDLHLEIMTSIAETRAAGTPLAYALKSTYFYDRTFSLSPDVLIPRPDTEILVTTILDHESDTPIAIVDVGTGSGAIISVLADHRKCWNCTAVDLSIRALHVARGNAPAHVSFVNGDRLTAFRHGSFDVIASNPPYIAESERPSIAPSVIDHEPHSALFDGGDGLSFYRWFAKEGKGLLREEGRIYVEIGASQGASVIQLFKENGWIDIHLVKDLGGRDRVVKAKRPHPTNYFTNLH